MAVKVVAIKVEAVSHGSGSKPGPISIQGRSSGLSDPRDDESGEICLIESALTGM